jgi:hypothetical protein
MAGLPELPPVEIVYGSELIGVAAEVDGGV